MTVREAARILELPEGSVYCLIRSGRLKARRYQIRGDRGCLRITEEALKEFIACAEAAAVPSRAREDCSPERMRRVGLI